jgi:hypothetical protein
MGKWRKKMKKEERRYDEELYLFWSKPYFYESIDFLK